MSERFGDHIAFLQWLQSADAGRQVHGASAIAMEKMAKLGFRNETDPYGIPWLPSQRAIEEDGQTLTDQGFLRASLRKLFGAEQADILLTRNYGFYHQVGAGHNPVRRMVPDEEDGLPDAWQQEIATQVERVIRRRQPR